MNRSDEQLIADYLEGDETALTGLVDRYLPDVRRFTLALTRDGSLADDATQEAFIKAWKNIRRFVPGNSFRAWLFQIARRTAIDLLRRRADVAFSVFDAVEGGNVIVDGLKDQSPLPEELAALAEDSRYATALLSGLKPDYRELLELRHSSNMTFAEIGQLLRRPLHTVKSQYRRALISLRRAANIKST